MLKSRCNTQSFICFTNFICLNLIMNVEIKYRELELNNPSRFDNKFWTINTVEGKTSPVVNGEIEGDLGLNSEKIVEAKLYPIAEINFSDVKISISREFYGKNDYPTVLGYVQKDGKTFLCTFYKSSSAGLWRYLPGYDTYDNGNTHFSKGHSTRNGGYGVSSDTYEHTLNLPIEVQKSLDEFLELNPRFKKNSPEFADENNLIKENEDLYFLGTTKKISPTNPSTRYFSEMPKKEHKLFGKYLQGKKIFSLEVLGGNVALPNPEIVKIKDSQSPDFSNLVTTWTVKESSYITFKENSNLPITEPVTYRVYYSKDKKLIYTFCTTEITKKSFCADIQTNSREITSFGCRKRWIDPGCLTTPFYEYASQTYKTGTRFSQTYGGRLAGNYTDINESYVSKLELIKQFKASIE